MSEQNTPREMQVKCGVYNVTIAFAEQDDLHVWESVKELIVKAYDERKRRAEQWMN